MSCFHRLAMTAETETRTSGFLGRERLLYGPWQAFERDVARLLLAHGFDNVRIVGGSGDHGGDVLGVRHGEQWVVQCKHTTNSPPPKAALAEVVKAAEYYRCARMAVAVSRPPSYAFHEQHSRYVRSGLRMQVWDPTKLLDLMARSPEYPVSRHQLRPYQEDASERFRQGLLDTGRGQIVMATGLGKTIVMAELVADLLRDELIPAGRVLVLAHANALINQLHRSFWRQLPNWVATQQLSDGEVPTYWDGITFATFQSVRSRSSSLPPFGLVLVDEAHHVGGETFQAVIESIGSAMLGGVTATPWRGDGYDIDQLLGPPLVRIGIAEGLREGFLSDIDYRLLADDVDWEYVQELSRHKYSLSQLNRKLILPTRDEVAARIIADVWRDEKRTGGLVFSPTITHANHFAAMLRQHGLRAEPISSATPTRDWDMLMSRFRVGEIDILTTVDQFNEGVDVPDVDLIAFMRVTHSRRIFVQQLGRGLRVTPKKDRVVVLDFVTDLRRLAEVVELDREVRGGSVERLGLGDHLVQFRDESAGSFLREWMLDQASLVLREGDPAMELPEFEYPRPLPPGGVQ